MTGPRGKRTPGGGLVQKSLSLNETEADYVRTALKIEADTLNGLITGHETPPRERYYAESQRRLNNVLVRRLDSLLDDRDEGSPPSEY